MNTETEIEITTSAANADTAAAFSTASSVMERFLQMGSVENVYGAPYQKDDVTIIPAAEILASTGFGVGSGQGTDPESQANGAGGGGGGGGYITSRPVAVIIITKDTVEVEPVVDATKIALAFFTAFGFMVATAFKMLRGPAQK